MSLTDPIFTDLDKARAHLEATRWPHGPVCPNCGGVDQATALQGKAHRPGVYQCNACRNQFTATVGTVFERSKVPLTKWMLASFLMASSKKGVSAHQLHRSLGVTYKTAWFMAHRLREAMTDTAPGPLGGDDKVVEADELCRRQRDEQTRVQAPRGNARRQGQDGGPISGRARGQNPLVHRRQCHCENPSPDHSESRKPPELMTDQAGFYPAIGSEFASHGTVNNSIGEYVTKGGFVPTKTVEGSFAILKRGVYGTFHHVSEAHLHRHLAEFDFR